VSEAHEPGSAVQRRTDPVVVSFSLGVTDVDGHADPERSDLAPLARRQRSLGDGCCVDRVGDRGEHGADPIAGVLEHLTPRTDDGASDEIVVTHQRFAHRVPIRRPQRRGTLDVGEQEGEGRHHRSLNGGSSSVVRWRSITLAGDRYGWLSGS
jgi:hypothetical protein